MWYTAVTRKMEAREKDRRGKKEEGIGVGS